MYTCQCRECKKVACCVQGWRILVTGNANGYVLVSVTSVIEAQSQDRPAIVDAEYIAFL